jgi:superkiller protein 3
VDRGLQGYRAGHNLAGIYVELGELSKAEVLWRQVVEESPWFAPAWHGLANVLLRQGKADEALHCAEMLKSHPDIREANRLRWSILISRGDLQTAREELNRALEEHPGDLELLEERCRLFFEHFPPDQAESVFQDLIQHDPQNAAGHHNLGTIHYKLGRFDEAASAYRRSIEFRPRSPSTHVHLGYALREAGKINEAIAAWKQALEIQPDDPLAAAAILQQARR